MGLVVEPIAGVIAAQFTSSTQSPAANSSIRSQPACTRLDDCTASLQRLQGRRQLGMLPLRRVMGRMPVAPSSLPRLLGLSLRRQQRLRSPRLTSSSFGPPRRSLTTSRALRDEASPSGPSSSSSGAPKRGYWANIASRLRSTPITWRPLPGYLIISLLAVLAFLKGRERAENSRIERERRENGIQSGVHIEGPWQVKVLGALPLRSISRLYGLLNSYELPVWFRVPGYHLYSFIFGVDISEADVQDLKQYKSLQEFFLRRLRPGVRPISDAAVVSPADGKVVNFGLIEERRVGSVKGMTYSVDALLQGLGSSQPGTPQPATNGNGDGNGSPKHTRLSDSQFANINDISYSVHELMGEGQVPASQVSKDASIESHPVQQGGDSDSKFNRDVKVASSVMQGDFESLGGYTGVPRPGNKMFFAVVYLHPGDYHRFHSPVSWVVERRRHFAGELFSVSPWMVGKLADLFTLNERVALLGRWRHGFFSYTPVGATNVGSIMINFDSHLRTNNPQRPLRPGTFDEAVYSQASRLLGGQPVEKGEEMGGFSLGSTIVLVFEAPEKFRFVVEKGKHVKYGEPLGIC